MLQLRVLLKGHAGTSALLAATRQLPAVSVGAWMQGSHTDLILCLQPTARRW